MAKIAALLVIAFIGFAAAKPFGGIGVSKSHVSHHSSVVSPYLGLGLGYGMMGLHHHGLIGHGIGHSVSSHSIAHHHVPHLGFGLGYKGLGMMGLYPGGIGLGYGLGLHG